MERRSLLKGLLTLPALTLLAQGDAATAKPLGAPHHGAPAGGTSWWVTNDLSIHISQTPGYEASLAIYQWPHWIRARAAVEENYQDLKAAFQGASRALMDRGLYLECCHPVSHSLTWLIPGPKMAQYTAHETGPTGDVYATGRLPASRGKNDLTWYWSASVPGETRETTEYGPLPLVHGGEASNWTNAIEKSYSKALELARRS